MLPMATLSAAVLQRTSDGLGFKRSRSRDNRDDGADGANRALREADDFAVVIEIDA